MKEIPIIYSAPMVLALLADRKSQTRRLIRLQPEPVSLGFRWRGKDIGAHLFPSMCGAGQPGDVHWVKENFTILSVECDGRNDGRATVIGTYAADGATFAITLTAEETDKLALWKRVEGNHPSIFMFRSLSRIRRLITEVRVQRLQEISEIDAIDEGVMGLGDPWIRKHFPDYWAAWAATPSGGKPPLGPLPTIRFRKLFESLNGAAPWEANHFVRAITFRRLKIET